jgi:hypothetical protein
MGLANQLLAPRSQKIRRMIRRTKATNQRTRKSNVDNVEDTEDVGDIAADTVKDTVYPKEGKAAEESVTRNHLTRRMTPSLSPGIIQRIASATINVPSAGRRATTRPTVGNTKSISQCA